MTTPESPKRVIGVDVGGTKTLAVMVELADGADAPPVVVDRELVPSAAAPGEVLAPIRESIRALMGRSGVTPAAVGIGLAGFVDRDGRIHSAPNLAGLVGVDVGSALRVELQLPVTIDNDANCVAVAAHALLGRRADCLVAVTFGTGIGGGLVIHGRLLRGSNGFAGEPGHMVIEPGGHPCGCGQQGCWEQYASGNGLARLAREACAAGKAPEVLAAAGSLAAVRGEHVTRLLDRGDAGALEVFTEYAGWVALGFANLRVLLDPDVIVVGGGLSSHGADLLALVERATVARFPSAAVGRRPEIVVSPGGPEGGAIGAALLGAGAVLDLHDGA
jgi:glucokinase